MQFSFSFLGRDVHFHVSRPIIFSWKINAEHEKTTWQTNENKQSKYEPVMVKKRSP